MNINRFELFLAMVDRKRVRLYSNATGEWHSGHIAAIQLEDGSGYNFNVTLQLDTFKSVTVFVAASAGKIH